MPHRLDSSQSDFEELFSQLLEKRLETGTDVTDIVSAILSTVRKEGNTAVIDYTKKFDHVQLDENSMRVTKEEIISARNCCSEDILDSLKKAHKRITDFHSRQIPKDINYTDYAGVKLGSRWLPIAAVGLYVPGGTAAYPSSVLMNAVPAQVAGVERIVMVVPTPDGKLNPLVLAAADLAGVDEIYRIGGAQAIGALAYGTETIIPVDKIVGPGNAYVASAKRQVFGIVGIDMIAGPSEILVVADSSNNPKWIAADLLSQSEHDKSAQSILVTDNESFANDVDTEITNILSNLPRADIARESWNKFGAIILVPNINSSIALIDRIAPEHLEFACEDADLLVEKVSNAGAIFIGALTPEAIGDYIAGPNHVLPTSGTSRFSSGLSVLDFMKRSSLISCSESGFAEIGPDAVSLAKAEGLEAHALSISLRLNDDLSG